MQAFQPLHKLRARRSEQHREIFKSCPVLHLYLLPVSVTWRDGMRGCFWGSTCSYGDPLLHYLQPAVCKRACGLGLAGSLLLLLNLGYCTPLAHYCRGLEKYQDNVEVHLRYEYPICHKYTGNSRRGNSFRAFPWPQATQRNIQAETLTYEVMTNPRGPRTQIIGLQGPNTIVTILMVLGPYTSKTWVRGHLGKERPPGGQS